MNEKPNENTDLLQQKKIYLFDETGMIRKGVGMRDYGKILYADNEEELELVILEMMAEKQELEEGDTAEQPKQ